MVLPCQRQVHETLIESIHVIPLPHLVAAGHAA